MFIRSSSLACDFGIRMSPFLAEQVRHRTRIAHVAAVLAEDVPDVADRAVAIVGRGLDQNRRAARPVAFEGDLFVGHARQLARAALNRTLDVVLRHVFSLCRSHCSAQSRILFRIAAALAAIVISLIRRVNILPRFASSAPFLCLIVAHFEWPDMPTS